MVRAFIFAALVAIASANAEAVPEAVPESNLSKIVDEVPAVVSQEGVLNDPNALDLDRFVKKLLSDHSQYFPDETVASAWKTITPSNTSLCVEVPGGYAGNGNNIWLWTCNGGDSQKWVFDNYQIRCGDDANFCLDACTQADGEQLRVRSCNNNPQHTFGYVDVVSSSGTRSTAKCGSVWEWS